MSNSPEGSKTPKQNISPDAADILFSGGGEMGTLMRTLDWAQTPIGPVSTWPQSLKTAVRIVLTSRYPMFVWWGPELVNLYNDPYRAFLGAKHPQALGKSAREYWAEIWDKIGPRVEAVLDRGESTFDEGLLLIMERHGYAEETYFTFSYSPLQDDNGKIAGLFCAVTEDTQKVIGERRLRLLREIAVAVGEARTPERVCQIASERLTKAQRDLPFSLIYLLGDDGKTLRRAGASGIQSGHAAAPEVVSLEDRDTVWPFAEVIRSGTSVMVENLAGHVTNLPTGDWDSPPARSILVPIAHKGQTTPNGVFVAGLNPHRPFDEEFRGFVSLLSNHIGGAIANALAYELERQRAEALAEIDRAKTVFFSNVSHEFRTPLSLIIGPMEDMIARGGLNSEDRDQVLTIHRNALRLLKLVNTLLDFSRIEAGRFQAVYEPTDLCKVTIELASMFESAIGKAGLRFTVDCSSLPEPVYVDRDMWEKIVVNLISNAFKFTFDGGIRVALNQVDDNVELSVTDTGTGIAANEIERVFERFHRIEGARGRTHEGTGIGLALVQELARLHGGTVRVSSRLDEGSTFTVSIPLGKAHLPQDRIGITRTLPPTSIQLDSLVEETEQWLVQPEIIDEPLTASPRLSSRLQQRKPESEKELVLVADDNADMRTYVTRLLGDRYRVHAVPDGVQAVEMARRLRPRLVVTDAMMPGLDGFGVLKEIRNDPSLSSIPVILLSARAGEDSRVEGLQAGADDYLVKPFTARELLARVTAHLKLASLRRQAEKSRRLYDTILSNTPDLAYVFDLNHRFIYANKALLTMWGRTWDEAIGKNCLELGYPSWHAAMHDREIDQVIATKQPIRGEVPFTGTAGRRIYDYIFVPVVGPDGEVEAIAGTTRDITERSNAEDALRQSEERFRAFVGATSDVMYRMNSDWTEMRELEGKDFIASTAEPSRDWLDKYIHPDDQERVREAIAQATRTRSTFSLEHRVMRVDGTLGWTSSRAIPVVGPNGELEEWFGAAADITERKVAEQALRHTEKLAATGRLAATIAHEINNPLEALTNLVYLAKHSVDRLAINEYLTAAEEELSRVSQLTKQTLGFYRETKGLSTVRLGPMVSALLSVFSSRSRSKRLSLESDIKEDPEVLAIPGEIRQLVANLISNSIDAVGDGGRIRIRVSAATGWDGNYTSGVRLTVADNGAGIPHSIRPRLFEPFVTTKKDVGTGLGLWVCKSIVEKHNGTIHVKSSTEAGNSWTVFSVFLPSDAAHVTEDETLKQAV